MPPITQAGFAPRSARLENFSHREGRVQSVSPHSPMIAVKRQRASGNEGSSYLSVFGDQNVVGPAGGMGVHDPRRD